MGQSEAGAIMGFLILEVRKTVRHLFPSFKGVWPTLHEESGALAHLIAVMSIFRPAPRDYS